MSFSALLNYNMVMMLKHLEDVSKHAPITRRDILQSWAYGNLWATGFRKPRGGKKGDTYDLYAHHTITTEQGIKALFGNALVRISQLPQ